MKTYETEWNYGNIIDLLLAILQFLLIYLIFFFVCVFFFFFFASCKMNELRNLLNTFDYDDYDMSMLLVNSVRQTPRHL